jgi:hypothetical protein
MTLVLLGAGLALGVLVTAACTSREGGTTPRGSTGDGTPTPGLLPPITVQRTGGFAGLSDAVTLDPHGAWSTTRRTGARATGELTPAQTTAIHALAADPKLAGEASRTRAPTRCSDAFHYVLTVGPVHVAYADCPADPDQPTASIALVRRLLQFVELDQG